MEVIQQRLPWVDILRGFLILTVILGHAFQVGDYNDSALWNIIYSFHMAAFFVLSGWIGCKTEPLGANGIGRRARALLLPLAVWSVIKIAMTAPPSAYAERALLYISHPDCTYWFLYALFATVTVLELWKWLSSKLSVNQLYIIGGG